MTDNRQKRRWRKMKAMAEITLHTGEMGSCFTVNLDFHDHNNIGLKFISPKCLIMILH